MISQHFAVMLRALVTLTVGAVVLYAIGHWLGWYTVAGILVVTALDTAWCARQARQWL